jgi:hypothetical protein
LPRIGPTSPPSFFRNVLRLIVELNGERVVGLAAVVGYLHTGFEKNMEAKTHWKAITYPERIDYVSFQNNELVFVLAIEKLLASFTHRMVVRGRDHVITPRMSANRRRTCYNRPVRRHAAHARQGRVEDVRPVSTPACRRAPPSIRRRPAA